MASGVTSMRCHSFAYDFLLVRLPRPLVNQNGALLAGYQMSCSACPDFVPSLPALLLVLVLLV